MCTQAQTGTTPCSKCDSLGGGVVEVVVVVDVVWWVCGSGGVMWCGVVVVAWCGVVV